MLAQHCDTTLELLFGGRAERESDPAGEHRGVRARLQLRLVLSCERPVLLGVQARSVRRTVYLLTVGVLDVGYPLAYLGKRITITKPTGMQNSIYRKPDALQRREQKLRAGTGEQWRITDHAEREHRLVGAALLAIDNECALVLRDSAVRAPPHDLPQRLIRNLTVASVDRKRVRSPMRVEVRLADTPRRCAAQEPLKLHCSCAAQREHTGQALIQALLAEGKLAQACGGDLSLGSDPC